jgi:hypothetical protein
LLPLAEWIVENWFHIFHEVGSKFSHARGFEKRHNLRFSGDGFVYPDLKFLPTGSHVDLLWKRSRTYNPPLEFVEEGRARIGRVELEGALSGFVDTVCARLSEIGYADTYLRTEWDQLRSLDGEEIEFATAAAALGLDPFDLKRGAAQAIIRANESLPRSVIDELFSVISVAELPSQIDWVAETFRQVSSCDDYLGRIPELSRQLRQAMPNLLFEPYQKGLVAAHFLRSQLKLEQAPIPDINRLLLALGASNADQPGCIMTWHEHRKVHAVTLGGDRPRFLVARRRPDSARFAACRSVYNLLAKNTTAALVTDSYFEDDRASRAFAAEFLAPTDGLRQRINTEVLFEDDVISLAEEFGVSVWVIEHQVENNGIAEIMYDAPAIRRSELE